jgi:tetratricopeptide (TPR) repeat protein
MRITPQLIRVADDTHLWAEVYERELAGIFALQSEIAERVVEELGVTLGRPEREAIQARPTDNLEAYQAYLRGRAFYGQVKSAVLRHRQTVENYEQAVELDPEFALAYAELSRLHSQHYRTTMEPASAEAARQTLERALELAPELPDVQLAQAYYEMQVRQDYPRALEVSSRVESSRPNDAEALAVRGNILKHQGRWEEAAEVLTRAADLNPRDLWLQGRLAIFTLVPLERYAEAVEVCDRAIALGPDQRGLYDTKAGIYWIWKGTTEEARTALETLPAVGPFAQLMVFYQEVYERDYRAALERLSTMKGEWVEGSVLGRWPKSLHEARVYDLLRQPGLAASAYATALGLAEDDLRRLPDDPEIHAVLGLIYAGLGRREEAIRAGQRAVELRPITQDAVEGPMYLRYLALIYTRVGEREAAIDELDRLLSIPFFQLSVPLLELEPWWDPLRAHPRYQALVRKHG